MKKRSPPAPSPPPNSSCSSSSSSFHSSSMAAPHSNHKPKPKRLRPNKIPPAPHDSPTSLKSRSSIYRGVSRHRWTGRFEAHLWDKNSLNTTNNKRGRQVYLGAYDSEEDAARAYDLAALKHWGPHSILNFPAEAYHKDLEEMQQLSKEEYLAALRRRSSGFSRGASKYRGVARHHHNGRWEARIGRVHGNKYLYLGTFSTEEEAAAAYDKAAIEFRGPNAITNFDISNYMDKLNEVPSEVQVRQEQEVQLNPENNPEPINKSVQATEPLDQQKDASQHVEPTSIPEVESTGSIDSQAIVVIESNEDHECHWDISMEIPSLNKLVQANEPHDHQSDANQHVQVPSVLTLESTGSLNSQAIGVMDPTQEHEHPWDISMDMGFHALSVPDIPLEKASVVFDYNEFADDIECIFEEALVDNELLQDAMSGSSGANEEMEGFAAQGINRPEALPSPTSSTNTSVCSNI